ncbi:MAG: O-acetyl-ADP-ribose deacetylase [Clostridiales bacterium]|nr:O-acetyl-ADP-ribose deacetylase [Clostridiales bacterium]
MEISAIKGDITKQTDVEAIVNAANESLLGGGGVDGAIHYAAGPGLLKECRTLGGCRMGEAKITGAYNLPCKYVIHTVGPRWHGGNNGEERLLRSCYVSCLELAVKNGIRTIDFPSISTGAFGYPVEDASNVAVAAVYEFVKDHPDEFDMIRWVCFDNNTLRYYSRQIGLIQKQLS